MIVKDGKIIAIGRINHDESLVGDGVSSDLGISESYKNVFSSYLNHSATWDNKIDSSFLLDYSAFVNYSNLMDQNLSSNIDNIASYIDNNSAIWTKDTTYNGSEYINVDSAISLIKIPEEIATISGIQTNLSLNLTELSGYTYQNINALSSDIYQLSSDIISLSGELNTVSGKIPELSSNITNISSKLNEFSADVSENLNTIYGNIDDLSSHVSENSVNIDKISGEIDTIHGNIEYLSYDVSNLSSELINKQDIISGGQYINVDKNIVSYTGPIYNNAFYSGTDLLGYLVNKGVNGQILSMSGDNFEWTEQSKIADVEIYGYDGINVNSSYSGNTLIFDISGSTNPEHVGFIELNTNLSAISANQDILDNISVIDNYLYTVSDNKIVIPSGTSQICVNVNAKFTPTAHNTSTLYEFGIDLLNSQAEVLSNQSKFALTSGSDVLSYSKLVKLDSSIENSIYFKFDGDSNQFELNSCLIDVYENKTGSSEGTSDTYEVKVSSSGTAGYLKDKMNTIAPIQNRIENDKYVIYQDPIGASPLSRISTPESDNVREVLNVVTNGIIKGEKIAIQLHAFTVGNYFVPENTDIWTYINTNIQGISEETVHFVGIYELDEENQTFHLVAMSVNGASHDNSVIGLASLDTGYVDTTYNTIKPSKIYYAFHACDQTALTIAGNTSSTYNLVNPYMSLIIYNISNALTISDFVANLATINISTTTLSHQESTGKRYLSLQHI
jgi:hypothetical protein